MIKEAIDRIIALAAPFREKIDGVEYYNGVIVMPPQAHVPLELSTLEGFAEYVRSERDQLPDIHLTLIHVSSPWEVRFISELDATYRVREYYARALYDAHRIFKFGQSMTPETFIIQVMSLFADNDDRAKVLSIVGNMAAEQVQESTDDGITQTVARRAGTSLKSRETIKNPFILKPHRTFAEIDQPESPFILRVHQAREDQPPSPALYETDNEQWKADAVKLIKEWLATALSSAPAVDVPIFA
jgi:hypothetical protein